MGCILQWFDDVRWEGGEPGAYYIIHGLILPFCRTLFWICWFLWRRWLDEDYFEGLFLYHWFIHYSFFFFSFFPFIGCSIGCILGSEFLCEYLSTHWLNDSNSQQLIINLSNSRTTIIYIYIFIYIYLYSISNVNANAKWNCECPPAPLSLSPPQLSSSLQVPILPLLWNHAGAECP